MTEDISLRLATERDAFTLARWRNAPEVRSHSFDSEFIPLDRHLAWLERKLRDDTARLYIAARPDGPAAQVRFDRLEDGIAEVSVTVAPGLQGRGLGRRVIELGSALAEKELELREIVAKIKPDNAASVGAFGSAGYAERRDLPDGTIALVRRAGRR